MHGPDFLVSLRVGEDLVDGGLELGCVKVAGSRLPVQEIVDSCCCGSTNR